MAISTAIARYAFAWCAGISNSSCRRFRRTRRRCSPIAWTTRTDHFGVALARIRIPADAVTQLATLRVSDILTGVYVDQVFTIVQGSIVGTLTVLPNSFTFTGPRAGVCGTGNADFIVFDGDPPYTAVASNPNISVTPTTNSSNPARFTVIASNPNVCVDTTIVVTDRNNRRATVTVKTEEGSATLPPLVVSRQRSRSTTPADSRPR
jgi:hypothetical protein